MRHTFTRQQLHDMVWERAVSKVGPELGISDVALRKQCIAHAIPLPGAIYWGRFHAGKPVERIPLPPLPKGVSDKIVIHARSGLDAPEEVRTAIAEARASALATSDVSPRSKLVVATIKAARRVKPDRDWSAVTGLGPEHFQIRAHPDALDRLEAFLHRLAHGVRARGWRLVPGKQGLDVMVDDEAIGFAITQTIRRVRHVATAEEKKSLDRWDARHGSNWDDWEKRPVLPWWDCTPTGEMRLEVQSWPYVDGVARRFADTRSRRLDDRMDDILVSFVAHAAARKVERVRQVERQHQEDAAKRERARLEHCAKLERARIDWLVGKLEEQSHAEALRRFVERLDADQPGDSWAAMRSWTLERLATAETRLSASAVAMEVAAMDAFARTTDS